ncbi:MAG: endonuclease IV, partial [Treponema sp.]|nr:endonuclease IV [Treponema sp.]
MNNKLHIGYHESVSDGFEAMGKEALAVGADTFAFFTRNPRGGKSKELNLEDVERLNALMKDNNFAPLVAHAPYT